MNNSNSRKKAVAAMAMLAALTGKSLGESIEEMLEGAEDICDCPNCQARRAGKSHKAEDYNPLMIETNKEGLNEMHAEAHKLIKFLVYVSSLNFKKDTKLIIEINEMLAEANINVVYTADKLFSDVKTIQDLSRQMTNAYGDFTIKNKIAEDMLANETVTEDSLNIAKEIVTHIDSQIKTFKENVENLAKEVALYKLM